MSYVLVKVYCPHCETPNVKKNGVKGNGQQNFYCKGCRKQFQFKYNYQGANPRLKKQVCEMAMRGSGIRDTANVLKMSAVTVILILRLWFKTHLEPSFEGTFENVIIDEMWSWVGKRKESKRWLWRPPLRYDYCADTRKSLAFQIGKGNDKTCQKLFKKLSHLTIKHYYTDDWRSYKKTYSTRKSYYLKSKNSEDRETKPESGGVPL